MNLAFRDLFGIEKYLHWGSVIHSYPLTASAERGWVLRSFEEFLSELQCQSRIAAHLLTVADEMMMNALYDAPTDEGGRFLFAKRSRSEPVSLPAEKTVELTFGSDGRSVAVGCRDPFGSLDARRVCASLARCLRRGRDQISQAEGGAGIGLFMVFEFVSHLVVNIDPGRATEFLGIVDITTSARRRHEQPHSFNIFVRRP